ncbi:MAG: sugar ABC transporter substrate-binding protein [Lachnospiraceae bacterium]|jgi:ABC-type sugar transport system substrate-binding protein|nr:sugar ABC transporter substrate-binding protein [Lachnospiraceae bacterium]MCI8994196.1 sugar ABC transporter substrate-binding protein [Lachnospiraceae bacterium]MCI9133472.1 sugar ABC transporter substrate-binding protein [Lachnospiraceae bacterium]
MKRVLALFLAAAMTAGLWGCANATKDPTAKPVEGQARPEEKSEEEPGEPKAQAEQEAQQGESRGTIGIGLFYLRDEYYIDVATRLVTALEEAGYETQVIDTDSDSAKMVSAIEDFTAKGYDGIICSGSELIASAVDEAVAQGIPVVCFDGSCNSENITANVTYDPIEDGVQVGNYVKQYIEDHWAEEETVEVAILDFPASAEICVGRTNGFISVMETIPNVKIVAQQDGKASRADSMAAAETILQANPDIKVAYGINFDTIAGFYAALDAIGKTDTICVASGSWGQEAIEFLAQDHPQYKAFTLMDPWAQADAAVASLLEALEGKDVEQTQAMSAVTYTAETIGDLDWKGIIDARKY